MKNLIVEGNLDLIRGLECIKDAKVVRSIYDCIYLLFFTEYEPDLICIGTELETKISISDTDVDKYLQTLNEGEFFPIAFGEMCREMCSEKKKKNPQIVVMCNEYSYPFNGSGDVLAELIKAHGMELVDFTETKTDPVVKLFELLKAEV